MTKQKEILYLLTIAVLIGACAQLYYSHRWLPAHTIAVYYNHDHKLNEEVTAAIRDADKFVYFAIYTFTRQDIADALLGAKHRGLTVIGITDRDQYNQIEQQRKIIDSLREAGIPVYQQDHSGIMHMKALVTDKTYLSGSYNWTASATNVNDEVLEVGHDTGLRVRFQSILEELFKQYGTAP